MYVNEREVLSISNSYQLKIQKNIHSFALTNRLELSFLAVFAFPNASRIGFVCNISCSIPLPPPRAAKYCIVIFAVSVFPAPLSPLNEGN